VLVWKHVAKKSRHAVKCWRKCAGNWRTAYFDIEGRWRDAEKQLKECRESLTRVIGVLHELNKVK